jgi:hypothetical protein
MLADAWIKDEIEHCGVLSYEEEDSLHFRTLWLCMNIKHLSLDFSTQSALRIPLRELRDWPQDLPGLRSSLS